MEEQRLIEIEEQQRILILRTQVQNYRVQQIEQLEAQRIFSHTKCYL